jgi:hypothetical protein
MQRAAPADFSVDRTSAAYSNRTLRGSATLDVCLRVTFIRRKAVPNT